MLFKDFIDELISARAAQALGPWGRRGRGGRRERCRLEGRQGISSVQADVRTIRGAPRRIVHSACQP